jgi:hypothetical protein
MGTTPILYDHGNNAADPDPDVARRDNGNVADDGTRAYAYNAVNRIHRCWRSGQELLAGFDYDALGSMIEKDVTSTLAGGPTGFWKFFHFLAQCVQEVFTTGGQAVSRQYVWGLYVDELIQQKELSGEAPPTYYPLSDLLYRTTALTDADQSIVETYDYDAYGRTIIFIAPRTGGWWADDAMTLWDESPVRHAPLCRYLFTGTMIPSSANRFNHCGS